MATRKAASGGRGRPAQIIVSIEGSEAGGHVRLTDFLQSVTAIKVAVKRTQELLGGRELLDFRIIDLHHNSPATLVLEEVAADGATAASVLPVFLENLASLGMPRRTAAKDKTSAGPVPTAPVIRDMDTLTSYRDLGMALEKYVRRMVLRVQRRRVTIDEKFQERLNKAIGPDECVLGSVTGVVERLNLHNNLRFDIYPPIGPKKVSCSFGPELRQQVIAAVDHFVTVHGVLKYKNWADHPYAMKAETIEIHRAASDLPTLLDLRGLDPGATGDLSSEEFIEKVRREQWH